MRLSDWLRNTLLRSDWSGSQLAPFTTELNQKLNINIPFTLYYGLITSIPTEWKKLLRNQNNCSQTVTSTLAPPHEPPSTRTAYSFLLNKAISPPTSENRILNYGFTKENIHKVYTLPFLITKDSKLNIIFYQLIQAFFVLESLKTTLVHCAKLKNKQSTICFSTVVNLAHFGKNSPVGGS